MELPTTSAAVAIALLPGFMARASAGYFATEARALSLWAELMHSALAAICFWMVFVPATGLAETEYDPGKHTVGIIVWFWLALGITIGLIVILRAGTPRVLKGLNDRFPEYRWSAGDRSPWLVLLSQLSRDQSVTVWTKSDVIYFGTVYIAPTRDDENTIVLDVHAKAVRNKDVPYKGTPMDPTPTDARQLVVLERSEISAVEFTDWGAWQKGQKKVVDQDKAAIFKRSQDEYRRRYEARIAAERAARKPK